MKKNTFALLLGLVFLFFDPIFAQNPAAPAVVSGMVTNEKEELLIGATVRWKGSATGAVTDTAGRFSLPARAEEAILVVTYVGHSPVELPILPGEDKIWVELVGASTLQEVTVQAEVFDTRVSMLETRNIESISSKELRKAPCCNLSESFQTNGAIDVAYPNALTGVKEIQLLGLRGIYSQFLVENRPTMGGIATPFAFEYVPGTWLSGIALAKGASTVKNGNAGISGQVNAELVNPKSDKPLFLNLFSSSEGRGELNLHLNKKGETQSQGLYLHGSFVANRWDMNRDNFKDSPDRQQLNALYRYLYDGPEGCAQLNVQVLTDRRQSGQLRPLRESPAFFDIDQRNDRVELWGKYGKEALWGRRFLEWGNILSASWHRSQGLYGPNVYAAEQRSLYWQSLLQNIIGTTDHKIVVAPSVQYDDIQEFVNEGDLSRREFMPGLMAEYTFSRPNLRMEMPDLVLVLGGRVDWNSRFGWIATPRASARYNFNEKSVLRLSAGNGFRSPNLVAENISLLASNRALQFGLPSGAAGGGPLGHESAWNYGLNYTQEFKVASRPASFSLDLYRTDFQRQILVDLDRDTAQFFFYNAPGKSFSNSLLATLQYSPLPGLDLKFAYKWNDVRAEFADGLLKRIPLVARHRGLVTADYTTPDKKWMFNTHIQIIGPQRLPDNRLVPHRYVHDFPAESPTFALWNAQVTRRLSSRMELYLGCENINGFQQHHAIIAANEPASIHFNGAQIWGPMMRQVGYLGLRYAPAGL